MIVRALRILSDSNSIILSCHRHWRCWFNHPVSTK